MAKKKNLFHQIVDPYFTKSGLSQTGEDIAGFGKRLLPANPFGDPFAPAFGLGRGKDASGAAVDPATSQSGEELLTQLLTNYSDQLGSSGVNLQDIKGQLGAEGFDLNKKGLKAADIMAALQPMGLQSNVAYKMAHPSQINSQQMQQLLQTITGYQKPYLDAMGATANLGAGMTHDFAKYLSPQSRAAYGDLTSAYQNQAKTLQNVIPAENPAAILGMLGGGGGTTTSAAPTSGLAGLMAAAGVAPTTPVK
jgi:hypothetical protein